MTPQQKYQQDLQTEGFRRDPAQMAAVAHTEALYQRLLHPPQPAEDGGLIGRWFKRPMLIPVKGLYFWGGTGRGKTYLLDSFYDCLPFKEKRRVHFQRFMQDIHEALKVLPKAPDPLKVLANSISEEVRVLCLDEFHVDDITDAMILAGLLAALFERGVTLVTSSNIPVDDLYLNGLQRSRFLPAIDLLHLHTEIVELDGGQDYRQALLDNHGYYHRGERESVDRLMASQFEALAVLRARHGGEVELLGRRVPVVAIGEDVIWFEFASLCATPRSATDYQHLAQRFATLFISHIPVMKAENDDVAQRFIQLIDALYDHRVKLVVSAEVEPKELYVGKQLAFAFDRTVSRLHEMRSTEYLSLAHR